MMWSSGRKLAVIGTLAAAGVATACGTAVAANHAAPRYPSAAHGAMAYVVNRGSGTVTPIRLSDNRPEPAIKVGTHPQGIVVAPGGRVAWVLTTSSVTPIRLATGRAGRPVRVGGQPQPMDLAITPNGRTVFVAGYSTGLVTPINTATDRAAHPIRVGGHPEAIAVTRNGKLAVVISAGTSSLTAINVHTRRAGHPVRVPSSPQTLALSPGSATAYVGSMGSAGADGQVTAVRLNTMTARPPVRVGRDNEGGPAGLTVTSNGRTVYVANLGANSVTPISTAKNQARPAIKVGRMPFELALAPGGRTGFAVNWLSQTVTPVNLATGQPGRPINAGHGSAWAVFGPGGKTLYVVDTGFPRNTPGTPGHTVTPIGVASHKAGKPIRVGTSPWAIVIVPAQPLHRAS